MPNHPRGLGHGITGNPTSRDFFSSLLKDYAMRALHTFALEIQRGDDREPSRVSVVLPAAAPDPDGVLRLTPQCITLDELEGAINALQDELDVMRADARRAFTVRAGHA